MASTPYCDVCETPQPSAVNRGGGVWYCDDCNQQWEQDNEPEEDTPCNPQRN